ncbi:DNA-binding protein HU [Actinobacillus pleuropneumoniae]|nr:DNA-binding protein HU [Actinobacillus pleuropneumoniae]
MNKSDLITQVAESTELSKKDATKAVDAVFDAISEALQSGDKVQLVGLATSRFASVPHGKAATRKQVKKSKSLRAKFLHLTW